MNAKFVISLDFEMFWGVAASRSLSEYRDHVLGEWTAVPSMLKMFHNRNIRVTWATVGMLMCRDYAEWRSIRPSILASYHTAKYSTYALEEMARNHPKLFFARPLVEQILQTPGQEIGGHSYSHFYCCEPGATVEQFSADIVCATEIASELGIVHRSFVFPRNQVRSDCLNVLAKAGYQVFRGNPNHWLYANGHNVKGGVAGRALRFADAYLPFSGQNVSSVVQYGSLLNCPASFFLRPWAASFETLECLRMKRLKDAMVHAAKAGQVFHLWWHPHNFGVNFIKNMAVLENLIGHYEMLNDQYGMESMTMGDCISKGLLA